MTDNIVNLSQHKAKLTSEIKLSNAIRDTESYESVIQKSIRDWHTYSVMEKYDLYVTLAEFNVEILHQLIEKMKDEQ